MPVIASTDEQAVRAVLERMGPTGKGRSVRFLWRYLTSRRAARRR